MNENIEIKAFAVVLLTLILAGTGCSINNAFIAERLVKEGSDPIKVRCMLNGFIQEANAIICLEAAKK